MMLLRAIARLMVYPDTALKEGLGEIRSVIEDSRMPRRQRTALLALVGEMEQTDLIRLQEDYVVTFDRGRYLSLHLFEHVHGESRDRGQAMVDLIGFYREHGLELNARELPDFLPLMLEFLSMQDHSVVKELLGDAMPVIVLLGARLQERESRYAVLFDALEALVGTPANADTLRTRAQREKPDWTLEKMDQIWEEEQVKFLGNSEPQGDSCSPMPSPPAQSTPAPGADAGPSH